MAPPKTATLILSLFLLTSGLRADPTAGAPSPGESVLIIYTNVTGYNVTLRDAFVTALTNIVPPATRRNLMCGALLL